jgi:lipopolysaccharide biosynthesis glycosyltransferase
MLIVMIISPTANSARNKYNLFLLSESASEEDQSYPKESARVLESSAEFYTL